MAVGGDGGGGGDALQTKVCDACALLAPPGHDASRMYELRAKFSFKIYELNLPTLQQPGHIHAQRTEHRRSTDGAQTEHRRSTAP